jgi:chemotaxis protein methyltransferase CheR
MDNRRLDKNYKLSVPDNFALKKGEKELLDVINRRLGIVVNDNQINDIRKIVDNYCEKFNYSPADYLVALGSAHIDSTIFKELVASITIGETYFFRDKKQMDLLKNTILPDIIHTKRTKKNLSLRIWSAGCASGEELYTIIIMLNELLPDIANWKLSLLGTDINTAVLQKALRGVYSEWSMRSISDNHKGKWFEKHKTSYYLNKSVIKKARFTYLNLTEDKYPAMINGTNAQDLIICRNVLIYFDEKHVAEIMKKLGHCLVDGGFLLLGASDPINYANSNLMILDDYGKLFSNRIKVENKVETHVANFKNEKKIIEITPVKTAPVVTGIDPKTELEYSAQKSDWKNIISIINNLPEKDRNNVDNLNLKATSLANLGHLEEAALYCEKSIQIDSLKIDTYFTYAMVLLELDRHEEAEKVLRKTLYLDINFVLGHYQLGIMLIHRNELEAGIKSLTNALTIVKQKSSQESIAGFAELNYGKLEVILLEEINLYEKSGRDYEKNE